MKNALSCSKNITCRGKTSKDVGEFHCLNCFHSNRAENKLKKHEDLYENQDYWYVEIPKEDNKMLKYNHGVITWKSEHLL